MPNNKKHRSFSLSKTVFKLVILAPTLFSLFGKVIALAGHETKQAGRSLVAIITLAIIFGILLTSTWLGVLAMLLMYLISIQVSWQLALFSLILINLLTLVIVICIMNKMKKNLLFPETREQLSEVKNLYR